MTDTGFDSTAALRDLYRKHKDSLKGKTEFPSYYWTDWSVRYILWPVKSIYGKRIFGKIYYRKKIDRTNRRLRVLTEYATKKDLFKWKLETPITTTDGRPQPPKSRIL